MEKNANKQSCLNVRNKYFSVRLFALRRMNGYVTNGKNKIEGGGFESP